MAFIVACLSLGLSCAFVFFSSRSGIFLGYLIQVLSTKTTSYSVLVLSKAFSNSQTQDV